MKKTILLIIVCILAFLPAHSLCQKQNVFSKDKLLDSDGYPPVDKVQHFFKGGITFTVSYCYTQSFWKSMAITFTTATLWEFFNAIGVSENYQDLIHCRVDGFSYNDIIYDVIGGLCTYPILKLFEYIFLKEK